MRKLNKLLKKHFEITCFSDACVCVQIRLLITAFDLYSFQDCKEIQTDQYFHARISLSLY